MAFISTQCFIPTLNTFATPHRSTPASGDPASWDWLTPRRFAVLLTLLIVACFPQIILGYETFVYGDAGQFALPVAFFHRESFWRGEWPLWNPFNSCGIPFAAQWNALAFYPLSLVYLLLPFPWSFGIFLLGHLLLAGIGMHVLAYRWTGSRLAASAAGTVFAFNGLTWYGLVWPHIIVALAWMPWVVVATEDAVRRGGRAVVVAALASAMQLLSGGAEVIVQTWLVIGALWVVLWFGRETSRWTLTLRIVLIGTVAVALAAVQLAPFLDLLMHSQRSSSYNTGAMGSVAAMPLTGWANLLVPLFHCAQSAQGVFMQPEQSWTGSYYFGAAIVVLAVVAVCRRKNPRVLMLAAMGVFGLTMALGNRGGVYEVFRRVIPLLGFIRFPVKFVMMATFAFPLLAAYALAGIESTPATGWVNERKVLNRVATAVLACMGLIVLFAWRFPRAGEPFTTLAANAGVRVLFLLLILVCVVSLRSRLPVGLQRLVQTSLIVLLWFDVFTHSPELSPTAPVRVVQPDAARQVFEWRDQPGLGVSRLMQSREALWKMLTFGSMEPELDARARRLSQFLNFNLLDHAPKFDGFYALDVREHLEIFKRAYFTTNESTALKNFLAISHVSNPTNAIEWVTRESFLPWITTGQEPVFVDDDAALAILFSDKFDPAHQVLLTPEVRSEVHAIGRAKASIVRSTVAYQRWVADAVADGPAIVVLAQTFYHPWKAYVDGKRVPLWRANYAFQALEIPAGEHRVEVVYRDAGFQVGAGISAVTLASSAAMWFRMSRKRRPVDTNDPRV